MAKAKGGPLASFIFDAEIIHWRGPPPYLFAQVPEEHIGEIKFAARQSSYGWGVVPVSARIGASDFTTSLFPRNGGYLVPIKVVVQRAEAIGLGDRIRVEMQIFDR